LEGDEVWRLPGKLHIGNKLPLEYLPQEDQPLAFASVAQAVTHQGLLEGGGQLRRKVPDLIGVAENYQTWLLSLDDFSQCSRVAVWSVIGE
jgi:hypothetical protein